LLLNPGGGNVGIGTTAPSSNTLQVAGSAGKTVGGTSWSDLSDSRLKNVLANVNGTALDTLSRLKPIKYEWNALHKELYGTSTDSVMYGFVAQELASVIPEMVKQGGDGYYWYNPSGFESILTAGLQELNSKTEALGSGFYITNSEGSAIFSRSRDIGALPNRDMELTALNITLDGNTTLTGNVSMSTSTISNLCLGGVCKAAWPDLSAYLTSYTEADPLFAASASYGIGSADIASWNSAAALTASTTALTQNISIDVNGNIVIGSNPLNSPLQGGQVEIVDITTITASSTGTAFVVNQVGLGEIADFQAQGVSVMSIAQTGEVKVVGSLLVDGRIMLCTGGQCSNTLDSAVDETMADLGVEGKVVAGAFEGYCDAGYVWAPGSAKYGTLPGFCVMSDLMNNPPDPLYQGGAAQGGETPRTNLSQGQAQMACQSLGNGYHLLGENEWLTLAENILQVSENPPSPL